MWTHKGPSIHRPCFCEYLKKWLCYNEVWLYLTNNIETHSRVSSDFKITQHKLHVAELRNWIPDSFLTRAFKVTYDWYALNPNIIIAKTQWKTRHIFVSLQLPVYYRFGGAPTTWLIRTRIQFCAESSVWIVKRPFTLKIMYGMIRWQFISPTLQSQLFHGFNPLPLHVYRSKQPQVFRRLTPYLLISVDRCSDSDINIYSPLKLTVASLFTGSYILQLFKPWLEVQ